MIDIMVEQSWFLSALFENDFRDIKLSIFDLIHYC